MRIDRSRYRSSHIGRLLLESSKDFVASANELIRERGHPYVQASHIAVISQIDEDGTELTTVVRRSGVTKQAVNKVLRQLEDHGLVVATANPRDGRTRQVCFTPQGRRFLDVAVQAVAEVEQEYREAVGDAEFERLKRTLATLLAARQARKDPAAAPASPGRTSASRPQASPRARRART